MGIKNIFLILKLTIDFKIMILYESKKARLPIIRNGMLPKSKLVLSTCICSVRFVCQNLKQTVDKSNNFKG